MDVWIVIIATMMMMMMFQWHSSSKDDHGAVVCSYSDDDHLCRVVMLHSYLMSSFDSIIDVSYPSFVYHFVKNDNPIPTNDHSFGTMVYIVSNHVVHYKNVVFCVFDNKTRNMCGYNILDRYIDSVVYDTFDRMVVMMMMMMLWASSGFFF